MGKREDVVSFRASAQLRKRLDEFAKAEGHSNRGQAIKSVLVRATSSGKPAVASADELLELLTEAARSGSVAAMKELRVYHREQEAEGEEADPLGAIDDLATRRRQRSA